MVPIRPALDEISSTLFTNFFQKFLEASVESDNTGTVDPRQRGSFLHMEVQAITRNICNHLGLLQMISCSRHSKTMLMASQNARAGWQQQYDWIQALKSFEINRNSCKVKVQNKELQSLKM